MDLSKFTEWLKGKITFQAFILAVSAGLLLTAEILKAVGSSSKSSGYKYSSLPKACICHECGYILRNPETHCKDIRCPKCGARMWRLE